MKIVTPPNASEDVEKLEQSYTATRNVKWHYQSSQQVGSFLNHK